MREVTGGFEGLSTDRSAPTHSEACRGRATGPWRGGSPFLFHPSPRSEEGISRRRLHPRHYGHPGCVCVCVCVDDAIIEGSPCVAVHASVPASATAPKGLHGCLTGAMRVSTGCQEPLLGGHFLVCVCVCVCVVSAESMGGPAGIQRVSLNPRGRGAPPKFAQGEGWLPLPGD